MSDAKSQLHLKVVTPTRVVVDAPCDEVALPGAIGEIGILPGHTPLLTQLRIGEMSYRKGMREHYLALQWGFAEIANDQVTVLAEVAELPEEIDVEAARRQKASAESALKAASGEEFEQQRAHLEAAVTRITVAARR
jgi:F-type H+-transporting ATPase subunit epsilon